MDQDRAAIFLTAAESDQLFGGLQRADAQRRFLDRQGISYLVNAKGHPLVLRESLLLGRTKHASPAPDAAALQAYLAGRGRRASR